MKELIILPAVQTGDMYGYSAIVMEKTPELIAEVVRLENLFRQVVSLDSKIGEINYPFVSFDVDLFNENYDLQQTEQQRPYTQTVTNDDYNDYTEEDDDTTRVESPSLYVTERGLRIVYNSKFGDSQVDASFYFEDFFKIV